MAVLAAALTLVFVIMIGVIVGVIVNSSIGTRRPAALIGLGIGGALLGAVFGIIITQALGFTGESLYLAPFIIIGAVLAAWLIGRMLRTPDGAGNPHAARAVGVTADGTPVYPVVGYTAQGQPVTSDKIATGSRAWNPSTNTLAVVTLVMAFVFPLAAIPSGHIARSQIRRTGEQGAGMALTGLIISYFWVIGSVITLIAIAQLLQVS